MHCKTISDSPYGGSSMMKLTRRICDGTLGPTWILSLVALITFSTLADAADGDSRPVQLIFDTDIGNDVDDCLALAMIHSLQSRGECELLGVTITKDHTDAGPFVDCINTFYGRGNIPIGVCRSGITPEGGNFNRLARETANGRDRYPHDLRRGEDAEDAVAVLRRLLAQADDASIVIAQVGFSTNLANLLASPGDAIDARSGMELAKSKVRLLSIMAGAFQKIPGGDGKMVDHYEYNVVQDLAAARTLAEKWPTEVVWSGFEIGLALPYPHQSILQDYGYVVHHPIAEAYHLYIPPPHDRPTWDLTSVLYAVRPSRNYFDLSERGRVTVDATGLTTHSSDEKGTHRYLVLKDSEKRRILEAMELLSSQPPQS